MTGIKDYFENYLVEIEKDYLIEINEEILICIEHRVCLFCGFTGVAMLRQPQYPLSVEHFHCLACGENWITVFNQVIDGVKALRISENWLENLLKNYNS